MKKVYLVGLWVIVSILITACAPAAPATSGTTKEPAVSTGDLSRPHPALSDIRVRKAIAHCIDRDALIAAAYTYVSAEQQAALRMDSWIPKSH